MEKWISGSGWVKCDPKEVEGTSKAFSDTIRMYEVFVKPEGKSVSFYRGKSVEHQVDLNKLLKDRKIIFAIKTEMSFKTMKATEEFLNDNLEMFNFCRTGDKIEVSFMGVNLFTYGRVDD